jgi:PPK2 family polyphosphate:nucleotide phosphotransferase
MIDRKRYRVKPGSKVDLASHDARHTSGYAGKRAATAKLRQDIESLASLQDKLNAQASHGLLVIFQGIDTAGKDGAIKHVMSGVNPQGVNVSAFKQPTDEERRHDYLWRAARVAPERGRIAIFNRSYYEDVIVVRVHPELLDAAVTGSKQPGNAFWERRFDQINAYERYLTGNGIRIVKFFLHISKGEQKKRLLSRLDDPGKQWKFSAADLQQRGYWDRYVDAYERMLGATSTRWAPWYVIPSDHKWFTRIAVADILVAELKALDLRYPALPIALRKELDAARAALTSR